MCSHSFPDNLVRGVWDSEVNLSSGHESLSAPWDAPHPPGGLLGGRGAGGGTEILDPFGAQKAPVGVLLHQGEDLHLGLVETGRPGGLKVLFGFFSGG